MRHLKINGQIKEFSADRLPATVTQLLQDLNIDTAAVVAEIDGSIVERKDFSSTQLKPGQAIELVRFVPGG